MLAEVVVLVRAAGVLEQVVVHDRVDVGDDRGIGELDEEVVEQVLAHVRHALVGADVDDRVHLGLRARAARSCVCDLVRSRR